MKKALCLLLALLSAAALWACGKPSVGIYELQKAMLAADTGLPAMTTVNSLDENAEKNFTYICDLDYEKADSYFLSYATEGVADEIVVIRLKSAEDVKETVAQLEAHRQQRIDVYKNYLQAQVSRAENAVIFSDGKYAVLIISNQADNIRQAFFSATK